MGQKRTYSARTIGLWIGLILFFVVLFAPQQSGLTSEAKSLLAITLLMLIWWVTEAIPIYATAFLPAILFPVLGIMKSSEVTAVYGHNYVLMLLGAFILAKGVEKQNVHKRIALYIIQVLGTKKRSIILGFMVATAFLSMWITNMAVVLIMLPIAYSFLQEQTEDKRFSLALLLGIAYAASVGGTGTLIGTPPNLIFGGIVETFGDNTTPIDFLSWMQVGVPVVVLFIPLIWMYLIRFYKIEKNQVLEDSIIKTQWKSLGKVTTAEVRVFLIFMLTALGWIFRQDFTFDSFTLKGWSSILGIEAYVHDSTVALIGAVLLFMTNDGKDNKLMDWKTAKTIPWGVAFFLGGGLALGLGFKKTNLTAWFGDNLDGLMQLPLLMSILLIILLLIFITEFNSNTATATIFLPILAAFSITTNVSPYLIMIPATFACSFAFMLPSGTGTNTVIFASERIRIKEMVLAGFWLNIVSAFLLTLFLYYWIPLVLE